MTIPSITIDNKALQDIRQIALHLFHDEFRFLRERDMLQALHIYLTQKGIQPNFIIDIKDEGTWWKR